MLSATNPLTLADWRRQVAELYAAVRHTPDAAAAWHDYRSRRDHLFATHPQSPLTQEQRAAFTKLSYAPYDPAWRVVGKIDFIDCSVCSVGQDTRHIHLPADSAFYYTPIAQVHFTVQGTAGTLSLFWIEGYGGGLFLPFKDESNGYTTYQGGRYLYDTIKGADLNTHPDKLILDFNYAYNPSCAYNDQWVCPLAPPENRLPFAVQAGEQTCHISIKK